MSAQSVPVIQRRRLPLPLILRATTSTSTRRLRRKHRLQDEVLASKLKGPSEPGSSQTLNLKALSNTVYKVYLVVKGNMNGSMPSDVMEIDVPKLGSYKIGNVCSTSGGTVTIDKKRADAREKITVTVTPKAGMKLDSLTYSTDLLGSAPVSILDKKVSEGVYVFDMPTANITIGCTWSKTSETDGPTITGFVINGTSGTISQSAGTIKITMPYGTDLTSLKPEITFTKCSICKPGQAAQRESVRPGYLYGYCRGRNNQDLHGDCHCCSTVYLRQALGGHAGQCRWKHRPFRQEYLVGEGKG